jgi:DNA-binding CsgD family transcriptional regulator
LVYNGINWHLYPVPNKTILRSIALTRDGKLYAGAQDEFGFYAADNFGKLVYTSLKNLLPKSVSSFADIWNIEVIENEVFFMASDMIFRYANKKLTFYKPRSKWLLLKKHNNHLIAQDSKSGILVFNNGQWENLIKLSDLPVGFAITDVKPFAKDTSLVSTSGNGLFLLTGNSIQPFSLQNTNSEQYFTAIDVLDKTNFLVGSYNSGLYKINRTGMVLDRISANNGLISNTIRCINTGFDGCTWIGLDNSIALTDWNNPIKHINPPSFNNGSGQGATVFNGDFYFALSTGLQWLPITNHSDLTKTALEPKTILNGLTWNISSWGNQLLSGRDDGLWSISDHKATNISNSTGFWNFQPINGTNSKQIACGNYFGVKLFTDENGKLLDNGNIKEFAESSRYLELDGQSLWVSHPYHGLYRINLKDNRIKKFTTKNGLPTDLENHVFKLKGKIVFATTKGIYEVDKTGNKIIPSPYYQKLLGNTSVRYLKEDRTGNIWFVHEKMLGVVDFNQSKPVIKYIPELHNHVLSGFENIFPYDSENVLVGSEIGFYNINYKKYREIKLPYATYLTSVKIIGNGDSIIYGGFSEKTIHKFSGVSIPYSFNSIHFSFATSFLRYKTGTEFSYYLEGYDKNWSAWDLQHEKEYTNLPEGNYVFHVKSRYGPSCEFSSFTYAFNIQAPWYRSFWAYLLYMVGFVLILFLLLKFQKRKLQKKEQRRMLVEKEKFEEEQRQIKYKYQLKLEKKEKAIIQLKNENLEAEVKHKNAELASNAMSLLQKKEFIGKIAEELNKAYLPIKDHVDTSEIKKILRRLSSEDKLDEEWKQFSIHFDNVHSNYLVSLKKTFPDLNAHEMKLCAYLRMNLSSKEIAQLLSISVRGVEISRYRLRKKLKLQPQEDLFEFLFKMNSDTNTKLD